MDRDSVPLIRGERRGVHGVAGSERAVDRRVQRERGSGCEVMKVETVVSRVPAHPGDGQLVRPGMEQDVRTVIVREVLIEDVSPEGVVQSRREVARGIAAGQSRGLAVEIDDLARCAGERVDLLRGTERDGTRDRRVEH